MIKANSFVRNIVPVSCLDETSRKIINMPSGSSFKVLSLRKEVKMNNQEWFFMEIYHQESGKMFFNGNDVRLHSHFEVIV